MLDKIIGAAIGGGIGKQAEGMDPTKGAIIGAAVPFVLRRVSLPAMIALGVGGYVVKKVLDKRKLPQPTDAETAPVANIPQPALG